MPRSAVRSPRPVFPWLCCLGTLLLVAAAVLADQSKLLIAGSIVLAGSVLLMLLAPTSIRLKALTAVASLMIATLLADVALRILTPFPVNSQSNKVPDEYLGYRVDPRLADIDAAGFRNPEVLSRAQIVALGDSHTYGLNAAAAEAWPQQLGRQLNQSVYNFGVGGYGILQYQHLVERALALDPKHLIVALYVANDLADVNRLAAENEVWREWLQACGAKVVNHSSAGAAKRPFRSFLRTKTAIGSLAAAMVSRMPGVAVGAKDIVVDHPTNPTVIKYSRIVDHERNTDLTRPEIAVGFAAAKRLFREAKASCDQHGASLTVLLVTSRERIYRPYLVKHNYQVPEEYHRLVKNEEALTKEVAAFLAEQGIDCVDTHPYLQQAFETESGIYPAWDDGHPYASGYKAYAQAALEHLAALQRSQVGLDDAVAIE